MKKFNARFVREFEVQIEADSSEIAERLTRGIIAQFPEGTARLLSITMEGYVEKPCAGCAEDGPIKPTPTPSGRPNGGGSPGTPVLPHVDQLEDQVAA